MWETLAVILEPFPFHSDFGRAPVELFLIARIAPQVTPPAAMSAGYSPRLAAVRALDRVPEYVVDVNSHAFSLSLRSLRSFAADHW